MQPMKRILIFTLCTLAALSIKAQTASVTITLRNGQTVQYLGEQYDSVRVLRNLQLTQTDNVGVKVYHRRQVGRLYRHEGGDKQRHHR